MSYSYQTICSAFLGILKYMLTFFFCYSAAPAQNAKFNCLAAFPLVPYAGRKCMETNLAAAAASRSGSRSGDIKSILLWLFWLFLSIGHFCRCFNIPVVVFPLNGMKLSQQVQRNIVQNNNFWNHIQQIELWLNQWCHLFCFWCQYVLIVDTLNVFFLKLRYQIIERIIFQIHFSLFHSFFNFKSHIWLKKKNASQSRNNCSNLK